MCLELPLQFSWAFPKEMESSVSFILQLLRAIETSFTRKGIKAEFHRILVPSFFLTIPVFWCKEISQHPGLPPASELKFFSSCKQVLTLTVALFTLFLQPHFSNLALHFYTIVSFSLLSSFVF